MKIGATKADRCSRTPAASRSAAGSPLLGATSVRPFLQETSAISKGGRVTGGFSGQEFLACFARFAHYQQRRQAVMAQPGRPARALTLSERARADPGFGAATQERSVPSPFAATSDRVEPDRRRLRQIRDRSGLLWARGADGPSLASEQLVSHLPALTRMAVRRSRAGAGRSDGQPVHLRSAPLALPDLAMFVLLFVQAPCAPCESSIGSTSAQLQAAPVGDLTKEPAATHARPTGRRHRVPPHERITPRLRGELKASGSTARAKVRASER
jgi:hypothetical protein